MLTKARYSVKDMLQWTRWELIGFIIFSSIITVLHQLFDFTFFKIPWTPVAVVGTAVAFIIGFQNNAAYGRIWEARKIWGGIVNTSRSWGMKTKDMITNEYTEEKVPEERLIQERKTMVYRHIAWLTALRHAMRSPKKWEVFEYHRTNREWSKMMHIPERDISLEEAISPYLSKEEQAYILQKNNKATAILYLQSGHLRQLKEQKLLWEFSFLDLENVLQELFTLQGKSERIKNFPYPRQYATLSHYFVLIFVILLPFAIIPEFSGIGDKIATKYPIIGFNFVWLAVPFYTIVSWIFHTMQRIGTVGENPFEGSANDVPISTISRGIEIDLRQLLDEEVDQIPKQFKEQFDVQM